MIELQVKWLVHHCYYRQPPQPLATPVIATLAGKELTVTRISMNARATPVRMEEPVPMALMDSHAPVLHSGLAHSARLHSKVWYKKISTSKDWCAENG